MLCVSGNRVLLLSELVRSDLFRFSGGHLNPTEGGSAGGLVSRKEREAERQINVGLILLLYLKHQLSPSSTTFPPPTDRPSIHSVVHPSISPSAQAAD